tara:strand:- start:396 stop:1928 length:1533 start_codon:yes stop_codon:yes gene_type:complete
MAGYSARQSTFTTGDTILAAHSNDEFNQVLAAFNATTGHTHDGTAGEGGPIKSLRDANSYNKIAIDDSNNHLEFSVNVSNNSVEQVKIQDGAIVPVTDDDIDLGTSSLEFKNAFFDGTVEADAITVGGTNITSLFAGLSGNTFTGNIEIDVASGDPTIILDTQGADKFHIAVDDSDSDNLVVKSGGTVGSGSGLKLDSSGNLIVDGDLTVSGDDITMGTNTAGNLLIADGTNFNSIAVGSLSEISTVASDDILLAVDTSGGGLKKITRSTLTAGIATGSEISNIVEDTTPQLGGNLDMNGQDIVTTSNANIELAANGTGHVVVKGNSNQGKITLNCESNSHGQAIQAQAHSLGIDNVMLLPKDGDSTLVSEISTQTLTNKTLTTPVINAGAQLKNGSTSAGFLEFFEDSDNGTNKVTLIGPASTSDITLTLPATAGTLVGTGDSGTLPLAAIDIDGGTDIGADLTTSDLIVVDDGAGGTNRKAALSRVVTLMTAQGFTTDDPTALAIALG